MDDLKIAQALGAVEGPLRALVAEAEGQGRIAGAAAEAERIWQVGKVLAKEWENEPNGIGSIAAWTPSSFLCELRKRAVPGEATFPAAWQTGNGLEPQVGPETALLDGQGQPVPNPLYDGSQDAPPVVMPFSQMLPAGENLAKLKAHTVPLDEPVKPFDNSGGQGVGLADLGHAPGAVFDPTANRWVEPGDGGAPSAVVPSSNLA